MLVLKSCTKQMLEGNPAGIGVPASKNRGFKVSTGVRTSGREGTAAAADGRTLAFLEVGPADGAIVLHNHGGPSSRLEAEFFSGVADELQLRFVCVDRPGLGRSSPQPGRTFEGWADDLLVVADSLGAEKFAVTSWSAGAPWAMAAAAYIDPGRLVHVASIAGGCYGTFGANWAARYSNSFDAFAGRLAVSFRPGFRFMYWTLGLTARYFGDSYATAVMKDACPYDHAAFDRPGVKDMFIRTSREAFAQGSNGLARDAALQYEAWPFDVAQIERPVHIWQGTADAIVPEPINRVVAERMPGAVYHEIPDGGHFIVVGEAEAILKLAALDLRT